MPHWIRNAAAALLLLAGGCATDGAPPAPPSNSVPAQDALSGSPAAGRLLARAHCAGCHAVERTDDSPLKGAPAFRDMGMLYPASDLQEAFAEGIVTAHPAMPEFQFTPQQITDLIAYLDSISGSPSDLTPSRGS